MSWKLPLRQGR